MMRNFGALVISTLGMILAFSDPIHGQIQKRTSVVHPASPSQMITVTLTDIRHSRHGEEKQVLIAQAAGFPNDTCDVITTFDVVKQYEQRQTWTEVRQRVDIVIDGKSYPAKFRDFGVYPLGLNLACVDFDSPFLHAQLQIPVLALERGSADPNSLSYVDNEIANSDPGTPFLNKSGEISSVLIATPNGPLEFASADDIRRFLKVAATVSAWPKLRSHSPSPT
jgi:hypothetical protein